MATSALKLEDETTQTPVKQVEQIILDFNSGNEGALRRLTPELMADTKARLAIRRNLVRPLTLANEHEKAERALKAVIIANPYADDEKLLLVTTLTRLGKAKEATVVADHVARNMPSDPKAATAIIQLHLQGGRPAEAANIALGYKGWSELPQRLAHLALIALTRSGNHQQAAELAKSYKGEMSDDIAALAIASTAASGDRHEAMLIGKRVMARGFTGAAVRSELGRICYDNLNYDGAIEHLTAAATQNPKDVRTLALLGELLVIRGRPSQAIKHLEPALEVAPKLVHVRAVYARALKANRDYDGAARELLKIVEIEPNNPQWKRQAAAALNQAGRRDEAAQMFEHVIKQREEKLPDSFQQGLDQLWEKIDDLSLPKARLDWAWRLRQGNGWQDRPEWERRVKWGYLADRLIYDWLECRTEQAEEAMWKLAELTESSAKLDALVDEGRGLIIAGAHIGPMFAGPLALQLTSFRSKWMASTPSISTSSYVQDLISTSDQTEAQVVKQAIQTLDEGMALAIAVDGAMSMASPRIPFEGQEITYSDFAARLAYRRNAASVFTAPQWNDGRLFFHVAQLPDPETGESMDDFAARWKTAYLAEVRSLISGEPENLRLSGGIWRHIKDEA